jgi:cell wall assembly regulator SMI1
MQDIEALERDLGFSLPAAYRNFLLRHNGARPADNTFAVGENNASGVNHFIPCDQIAKERQYIDHVSPKVIPIARDDCGNAVILDPEDGGSVFFWDHEIPDDQIKLASGIDEFLELLAPPDDEIELDESQVKRVWTDPEFARKYNLRK